MSHRRFQAPKNMDAAAVKKIFQTLLRTGAFCGCTDCDRYHAEKLKDLNTEIQLDEARARRVG